MAGNFKFIYLSQDYVNGGTGKIMYNLEQTDKDYLNYLCCFMTVPATLQKPRTKTHLGWQQIAEAILTYPFYHRILQELKLEPSSFS